MTYAEQRAQGIGSGEIAAVCGVDPYKSRMTVWEEKVGLRKNADSDSHHIRRGRFLEPALREWLSDIIGEDFNAQPIDDAKAHKPWFIHPTHTFILATPDGLTTTLDGRRIGCELKAPDRALRWGDEAEGAAGVPREVIFQVSWQMLAADLSRVYVAALVRGNLRVYPIDRNETMDQRLIEMGEWFMNFVKGGVQPPVDGGGPGAEWLKETYPVEKLPLVQSADTPAMEDLIRKEYLPLWAQRKEIEKKETELKNKIQDFLAHRAGVQGDWGRIDWKAQKSRAVLDWKSLAESYEERYSIDAEKEREQFTTIRPGPRVFRAYPKKEKK